ncbi:MAG TPA: hypothetical protein VII35_11385 [Steroidobacteraceae bacterium]
MADMVKHRPKPKKPKDQHAEFVKTARSLGADMSEEDFKRAIAGKLAKQPAEGKK